VLNLFPFFFGLFLFCCKVFKSTNIISFNEEVPLFLRVHREESVWKAFLQVMLTICLKSPEEWNHIEMDMALLEIVLLGE